MSARGSRHNLKHRKYYLKMRKSLCAVRLPGRAVVLCPWQCSKHPDVSLSHLPWGLQGAAWDRPQRSCQLPGEGSGAAGIN